ncbi:MAG: 50S ribosomal protein L19e [Candidatus Altiarchaeales archaeon]|nr:MAG: 50S ribosomal protein L19e [Candidatus Altiarchaeales archaeon]
MNLTTQKRLAAEILNVGINRVWIDPERIEDVSKAITRDDIKYYIANGAIASREKVGISRGRFKERLAQKEKGRRKGYGRRSGKKGARTPKKEAWMKKVRALRDELRKMKNEKKIDESMYRKFYRQIKGNLFHSRRHLREHTEKEIEGQKDG